MQHRLTQTYQPHLVHPGIDATALGHLPSGNSDAPMLAGRLAGRPCCLRGRRRRGFAAPSGSGPERHILAPWADSRRWRDGKTMEKTWTCSMLGEKLVASFWKFHDTPENHQFREDENWLKQAYQKNRCCLTGLSTKWGTILYFLNLLTLHSLRQILAEQKNASSARRNWECPTGSPNKGIP